MVAVEIAGDDDMCVMQYVFEWKFLCEESAYLVYCIIILAVAADINDEELQPIKGDLDTSDIGGLEL